MFPFAYFFTEKATTETYLACFDAYMDKFGRKPPCSAASFTLAKPSIGRHKVCKYYLKKNAENEYMAMT